MEQKKEYALAIIARQDGFEPRGNIKKVNNSTVGIGVIPVKIVPYGMRLEINPKFNNLQVIEMLKDTISYLEESDKIQEIKDYDKEQEGFLNEK